jgi:hypothetical protein
MDNKERDEILYRVDERTERMEEEMLRRMEKLENKVGENSGRIDTVESNTLENSNDLKRAKTLLTVIGGAVLTALGKVFGAIKLI